ncbi:MAG: hypothetical protein L3J30_00105 [Marinosulfonomonas sp.]|nr:hypothetical protein [Marinosulfonomonas sp.]
MIDDGPVRIIALDSLSQGEAGGMICDVRAAWLRDCLAQGGMRPTVIFMHHPPLKCGVPETGEGGFAGADMVMRMILRRFSRLNHAAR